MQQPWNNPGTTRLQPVWTQPLPAAAEKPLNATTLILSIGGGVLAFASLVFVLPFLLRNTGTSGFFYGFLASLVPLAVVLGAVYLMDRWEPEPKRLLVFALLWGATVSIATTTLIQPTFMALFGPRGGSKTEYLNFLATVEAPVVEEFSKSLGLLVLILVARKYFDGPVDGVVFAFTIAAGFAFTENILYFGRQYAESATVGPDFWVLVFMRGILSPFAHAIFTGTTGLLMGLAARQWNTALSVAAFVVGLIPAMFLHNRWNSMGEDFLWLYLVVQFPIFVAAVVGFILLRVHESKLTRKRLSEYAAAGWFTPQEVQMLATGAGRKAARRWSQSVGRYEPMKAFIRAATSLAFTRQRMYSGRSINDHQRDEQRLLEQITVLRAAVVN
ncbi:PrsW family intramembrane metalloprotease [Pseudarthrobacter sp. J1738]|uniref:PrsW family intramembrane metalloprotease n=1 Tax=Pseudarthrobacter sp. J1738 TaxID=3420446 RepID=UPI003D2766DA